MITITMTDIPEQTVSVRSSEDTLLVDVLYIQNISRGNIYWSTEEFSDTNIGTILNSNKSITFEIPETIYIRNKDSKSIAKIHTRGIAL